MISNPITPDLILLTYIVLLSSYLVRKRKKGKLHDLDAKLFLVLLPSITLVSLASSSFARNYNSIKYLILALTTVTILACLMKKIKDQKKAYILETATGAIALSIAWSSLRPEVNLIIFSEILFISLIPTLFVYLFFEVIDGQKNLLFIFPVSTHFFDAASTVIALEKGLKESRTLARIFIEHLGSYGVFVMKALVIIPISYYLVKDIEGNFSREVLYMIGVYGLVLGLRNYFLLV